VSDISPLCLNCLRTKLADDYAQFSVRALVIEPAANLPCYVFQPSSKWKDRKLADILSGRAQNDRRDDESLDTESREKVRRRSGKVQSGRAR
jgi:hypothetical protein